jgi:hypothetical protein
MMRFTFCFNASVMKEGRPGFSASWTSTRPFANIMHHFRTLAVFITCSPYTATSLWWISQGLTFSAFKNRITPRTSQPAEFDISAFIVSTYHTHNVVKFAARTAPGNCPHSTGHTTWLISYSETTARVVCANVLYFLDAPHIFCWKCSKFYRIMNDVCTRTVVCCCRGRIGTDLSVL